MDPLPDITNPERDDVIIPRDDMTNITMHPKNH